MNPIFLLFKPLFILFTWILTGFVAIVMALGGKFDGRARDGSPPALGVVRPATRDLPPEIEVRVKNGERYRAWLSTDPRVAVHPSDDVIEALGPPPEDMISAFVALQGDRGGIMICRLSYDTVDREAGGSCVADAKKGPVYDLHFVDESALRD
jgi:hypothetical protein